MTFNKIHTFHLSFMYVRDIDHPLSGGEVINVHEPTPYKSTHSRTENEGSLISVDGKSTGSTTGRLRVGLKSWILSPVV